MGSLQHVGRACIAGALLRYFQDMSSTKNENEEQGKEENNMFLNSRILESYDLSQNSQKLMSAFNEESREIPLFKESMGLTSIELSMEYQTARSRLMSVAHPYDM